MERGRRRKFIRTLQKPSDEFQKISYRYVESGKWKVHDQLSTFHFPFSTLLMSKFQIFTPAEITSMRKAGKILRECLQHTAAHVKPGITTLELDQIAEEFIRSHEGAVPAFKGYRNYPHTLCTSVNDQCVHGLPG